MNPNLYANKDSNIRKTWFLMLGFLVLVIAVGWAFSYVYNAPWILYLAIAISLIMNVTSYWYSDKIALSISGAKVAEEEKYGDLHNLVENISITAGIPKPRVFVINDPAPNAFATGRDPKHSAVAFTTGLLERLERSELEGVVAHEISHITNRDILLSTVVVVLVGMLALLSDLFLRITLFGGGDRDNKGNAWLMLVGVILIILSPIIATLIQLAISRKREFLADSSGVLLTRYPEGLANALRKISSYSSPMKKANNATAHLFIANPFGSKKNKGLHKLFQTHPPVEERIEKLIGKNYE